MYWAARPEPPEVLRGDTLARRDRKGSLNHGRIQNPSNPFGIVPLSNFVQRGSGFVHHSIAILFFIAVGGGGGGGVREKATTRAATRVPAGAGTYATGRR
jgi:hypothetical protein